MHKLTHRGKNQSLVTRFGNCLCPREAGPGCKLFHYISIKLQVGLK